MSELLSHFGVYDFFGIWGVGIVSLTHCVLSTEIILQKDYLSHFKDFASDYSLLLILIYSVIAYLIGIVLHELGKWIFDVPQKYYIQQINEIIDTKRDFSKRCNRWLHPNEYERYKVKRVLNNLKEDILLDEAISELKHEKRTDVINKYHAIYGLSRGLFIGMCITLIISLITSFNIKLNQATLLILGINIFLLFILYCRTYRSYMEWIKNVFIQYSLFQKYQQEK